jgi:hypothetical protein
LATSTFDIMKNRRRHERCAVKGFGRSAGRWHLQGERRAGWLAREALQRFLPFYARCSSFPQGPTDVSR